MTYVRQLEKHAKRQSTNINTLMRLQFPCSIVKRNEKTWVRFLAPLNVPKVETKMSRKGNCHKLRMHLSKIVCDNMPGFLATFRSRNLLFWLQWSLSLPMTRHMSAVCLASMPPWIKLEKFRLSLSCSWQFPFKASVAPRGCRALKMLVHLEVVCFVCAVICMAFKIKKTTRQRRQNHLNCVLCRHLFY